MECRRDTNLCAMAGVANIGDVGSEARVRLDKDIVPEAATRPSQDSDYHTGRGGAGNEHVAEHKAAVVTGDEAPKGLADKLKYKIFGAFKK